MGLINNRLSDSSLSNGITFSQVLKMVISHASLFLDEYEDKYTDFWNEFTRDLRHPTWSVYPSVEEVGMLEMVSARRISGKVVLEHVIALLLDKKAKPGRKLLPSATKLRLWLLPCPCFPEAAEVDSECRALSAALEKLLDSFLEGEANVLHWPQIAEEAFTVSEMLNTDEELRVAVCIGDLYDSGDGIDQRTSALKLVRLALAIVLIVDGEDWLKKSGKDTSSEHRGSLRLALRSRVVEWQSHFDDTIRGKLEDWRRKNKALWEKLAKNVEN